MINKITLPEENYNVPDYDEEQSIKINEIVEEVNDHSNKLLDLLARFGLIADYVIETGKNEYGSYEKWHSGKMEIWAKLRSPSFGTLTKEGEMYKSSPFSFNFPISFITPPAVFIQFSPVEGVAGGSTTTGFPKRITPATNSNTGQIELLQNIEVYNNRTTSADIHAIGRWKA